jgi:hypothetical protein
MFVFVLSFRLLKRFAFVQSLASAVSFAFVRSSRRNAVWQTPKKGAKLI